MIRRTTMIGVLAMLASAISSVSTQAAVSITAFNAESTNSLAGAHADVVTSFHFRQLGEFAYGGDPASVIVTVPRGLVGNPQNVPSCPRSLFGLSAVLHGGCPADTQVGFANINFGAGGLPGTFGVFNVQPGPDRPAMLGIQGTYGGAGSAGFPVAVPILLSARAEDNYAITAATEVQYFPVGINTVGANVTLWGVPASHLRTSGRGFGGVLPASSPSQWQPFMENPTDCSPTPVTKLLVNTTEEPEVFSEALATSPNPTDCARVPFAPSISLTPDITQAGLPTGLAFELTTPQSNDANGRGTAELKEAVATLPAGMTISPSAAARELQGCTDAQFGAGSDAPASCPAASQIGTAEVESPLLPQAPTGAEGKLTGHVFLGQPLSTDPNSGKMFRVFQELRGFGLDVKIEGSVLANPETGQLTATFANLPELPFQSFRLHLDGGPNAVLVNPQTCGASVTTTQLYPYSGNPPATPSSTFTTTYDGNGAPCPSVLPFAPSSSISTASSQAGALSPLAVTFARADETQALGRIEAKLPAGLLGYVSKVQLCEAARATAGSCPAESRVGTVSTSAGAGPDPLTVQGSVYLARGSNGYPFMLSVVVPAVAGPYSLGDVVVPVWLQVNSDGSLTAISGALPSILDGIPLDIRSVTMTIDRPGFTVNPTNCDPLAMSGKITSLGGVAAAISAPFEASGCGSLPFAPSFTVTTQGSTSKTNGASLTVRVAQKPGEADIRSVHVELPRQLPSRLTTLRNACPEAQFDANPAGCPAGSVVGTAITYTPTVSSPLSGPAILVSHGGAAFPDLEIVLQGEGATVILDGATDIKKGVTTSTFASVPDVPISGFELTLPEGPYSLLGPYGTLCTSKLIMPTTITGQNGLVLKQTTRIAVTGCRSPKPAIKVIKTKARAGRLIVTVETNATGTVRISGSALGTKTTKDVKAGTSQIPVSFTKAGQTARQHHKKLKLQAMLTVGKLAVAKTTSVKL
jgi:hypothetical protein